MDQSETTIEIVEIRKDIESLTKTIASLASSVDKLVQHQYKYELLQQEVATLRREITEYVKRDSDDARRVWKTLEEQDKEIEEIKRGSDRNTWAIKLASTLGALGLTGIVTWIVKVVSTGTI